jgi:hypothetical protein
LGRSRADRPTLDLGLWRSRYGRFTPAHQRSQCRIASGLNLGVEMSF